MARQETKPRSEAVASFILKVFKEKITELSSQPLRYAAFSVLKSPDIPSILIEAGFMSTSSDLQNLTTKKWRREFADSLAEAISRWHVRDKENKSFTERIVEVFCLFTQKVVSCIFDHERFHNL